MSSTEPAARSVSQLLAEISALDPSERNALLRAVVRDLDTRPKRDPASAYRDTPPGEAEFSSDDDPLAWEADGWEKIG